jgi:hypothetical protein
MRSAAWLGVTASLMLCEPVLAGPAAPAPPPAAHAACCARRKSAARGLPSDADLERLHAVFGKIVIDNENIFNLNDPKDDNFLFRLADRLHRPTRRSLIRAQLLFHTGEPFSRHLLDESARILRADPYFYDATIQPVRYRHGRVDVLVRTRDVWTLNPGFDFGRSGGTNTTGLTFEDINVFGTGTGIELQDLHNIERSEKEVALSNQHVFGTWTGVDVAYGVLSDGLLRSLTVERPFYAFETHYAGGVSLNDTTLDDSLYDLGQVVDKFAAQTKYFQGDFGWSPGLIRGWTQRFWVGWTYDRHRFAPSPLWSGPTLLPANRKFVYPWVQFDWLQDKYVTLRNHNQIHRLEDFNLGFYLTAQLGWAARAFGSSQRVLPFAFTAGDGYALPHGDLLQVSSSFSGRMHHGTLENGLLQGNVVNFFAQAPRWLLYTALRVAAGRRLTLDNQILLGGDNGLEGFPLRYQDGTASALFTVQERWFSNWYPLRLFRVGAAVFFDMGRTWGRPPLAQASLGLLEDAGFGLRLGNARTAFGNVIHIDFAFPINGGAGIKHMQFLVQTEKQF